MSNNVREKKVSGIKGRSGIIFGGGGMKEHSEAMDRVFPNHGDSHLRNVMKDEDRERFWDVGKGDDRTVVTDLNFETHDCIGSLCPICAVTLTITGVKSIDVIDAVANDIANKADDGIRTKEWPPDIYDPMSLSGRRSG